MFHTLHILFNEDTINSTSFNLIKPILNKLNYSSIIQIRANLILRNEMLKLVGILTIIIKTIKLQYSMLMNQMDLLF